MPRGDGSWTFITVFLAHSSKHKKPPSFYLKVEAGGFFYCGIKVNDVRKRRFLIIIRNRLFYINDNIERCQTTLFLMELLSLTSGSTMLLDERLTGDKSPSTSPNA